MRIVTPFDVDDGELTTTNVVNEGADWEPAATNLLSYPRRFDNAAWSKTGGDAQVFPNTFLAPDGTLTAQRVTAGIGYVAKTGVAQSGMVKSIYLRSVSGTGKIGTLVNSATQVFDINENWQRFDYPAGDSGADANFYVADFRSPATLTEVVVWHAQLEEGSFPTSIIPDATTFTSRASTATYLDSTGTLQTAGVDVARDAAYGYVDGVLKPIGLLLEGASTNLIKYSETNGSNWAIGNSSRWANSPQNIKGITLDQYTYARLSLADYSSNASSATWSIFFYDDGTISGESGIVIRGEVRGDSVAFVNLLFDYTTKIFSTTSNDGKLDVIDYGDGFYRVSLIIETQINNVITLRTAIYSSDVSNSPTWLGGFQLEQGSYPTSYIPTQGAQVTRAADVSASPQATRDLATYNLGDQAVDLNQVYKVVADPDTTDQPSVGAVADPPTWVLMGWSNQYRMFRDGRDSFSSRDESIAVNLNLSEIITTFAAIGLKGVSATLKMVDSVDGTVYDETISLGGIGAGDWWEYFFLQYDLSDTAIFKELPAYPNADISFTVSGGAPSDQVIVGRVIAGAEEDLGVTNYGTSVSILDYSTKERDGFGNLTLVPRRTVRLVDYNVKVPSVVVDFVVRSLERIAATPTLFIGDALYSSSVTFGVYRDFTQGIDTPSLSDLTIQVEGF